MNNTISGNDHVLVLCAIFLLLLLLYAMPLLFTLCAALLVAMLTNTGTVQAPCMYTAPVPLSMK